MKLNEPISEIQTNCMWVLVNLMSGVADLKGHLIQIRIHEQILTAMEEHMYGFPRILNFGSTQLIVLG